MRRRLPFKARAVTPAREDGLPCLSLHQPYASLVIGGHIGLVSRPFYTSHRGPLMIHAAHRTVGDGPALLALAADCLGAAWPGQVPRTALIGRVQIHDCLKPKDYSARLGSDVPDSYVTEELSRGGYMWLLILPTAFVKSVPFHGHRRLYVVPDRVVSEGELQLGLV